MSATDIPFYIYREFIHSHLPGENSLSKHAKTVGLYQIRSHTHEFLFHQVTITAGWTSSKGMNTLLCTSTHDQQWEFMSDFPKAATDK